MNDDELIKKWKVVLDYTNKHLTPVEEKDRILCAKEMEEIEKGEGEYIYKSNMIPAIRGKYSNIPTVIENFNGKNYLVSEVNVIECVYEETPEGETPEGEIPKWKNINKTVKWYFPILEDKSDKSYNHVTNIHVFGRGYTDGIYHMTPKYGASVMR